MNFTPRRRRKAPTPTPDKVVRVVVKVQIPIASFGVPPLALIYDERRTFEARVPLCSDLIAKLRGPDGTIPLRSFFVASFDEAPSKHPDGLYFVLGERVEDQGW